MPMMYVGLQPTVGLAAQVGWPGLRVGGHLALVCIRQMNRVNSCNDLCHDDSTMSGVVCWQVTLCDPHLSALEVRFSRRCAIQIDVYLYLYHKRCLSY